MLEVSIIHESTDWASKMQTIEFTVKGDYIAGFFGETKLIKSFQGELFTRLDFGVESQVLYMDCEANDIGDKSLIGIIESIYQTCLKSS